MELSRFWWIFYPRKSYEIITPIELFNIQKGGQHPLFKSVVHFSPSSKEKNIPHQWISVTKFAH